VRAGLTVGAATVAAVVAPFVVLLSVVRPILAANPMGAGVQGVGMGAAGVMLMLPAGLGWGAVLARVTGAPRWPTARRALKVGVLTAIPVAVAVDFSQILIDIVAPWHRFAVHAVFGTAFTLGLAVFFKVLAWRMSGSASMGTRTSMAAAIGTAAGAVWAVQLDWVVMPDMRVSMLWPLYLVLATGATCGGSALGWQLGATETRCSAARGTSAGADAPGSPAPGVEGVLRQTPRTR
jgi:hypothetical protein